MNDDHSNRDSRQREHSDGRDRRAGGPEGDRAPRGGEGADTRFLQLEMSQVLYAEAEGVTKQAFRELLLEAAKDHLRARFGEAITGLARLATDELLADIEASLDVEAQIERRRGSQQGGSGDRLRAVLSRGSSSDRPEPAAERKSGSGASGRKRRR